MQKLLISLSIFSISTLVSAEKWDYSKALKSVANNEAELAMCAPAPEDAGECYESTISQYSKMIKEIRSQNSTKLDTRLWQSINLNYKNAIDTCRSENNISVNRLFFYPYQDCMTNHLHNLLITTIELHLK